jgi:hypothetical protein
MSNPAKSVGLPGTHALSSTFLSKSYHLVGHPSARHCNHHFNFSAARFDEHISSRFLPGEDPFRAYG